MVTSSSFSSSSVVTTAPARSGDGNKELFGSDRKELRGAAARRRLIFAMGALLILFTFHVKMRALIAIAQYETPVPEASRWTVYPPLGQPVPSAFVHIEELRTSNQKALRSITNNTEKMVMSREVYATLTNRIRKLKHARKPLRIMINSHPCAGKSAFLQYAKYAGDGRHPPEFMGCKLVDFDWLTTAHRDSSYLMQNKTTGSLAVTNRTALFGDSIRSSKREKFDDVIYIYVIPPLAIIERNIKHRQKQDGRNPWSQYQKVIERRRQSLLQTVKDGSLVEPLFPSFQEGLEFCINTYDIERIDDPDRDGIAVVKIEPLNQSDR